MRPIPSLYGALFGFLAPMLFSLAPGSARATWSVVAVDQETRRVVIATATCVPQAIFAGTRFRGVMDVQGVVSPGAGAAVAQASSDPTGKDQALIAAELKKGTAPPAILKLLKRSPEALRRQFAIVDLKGRTAVFTGAQNTSEALHTYGGAPGTDIIYSVQGNTLRSRTVVLNAAAAFRLTDGTVADRAMAALEAGDAAGGDARCSCASEPAPKVECRTRNATVAYLLAADPGDRAAAAYITEGSHVDGDYALFIHVNDENTLPAESANAVETLRMRYDAWRRRVVSPDGEE